MRDENLPKAIAEAPPAYETLRRSLRLLRSYWVPLAVTDIAYKVLAFVILTPIVTFAFRLFVKFSGRPALADHDILRFFTSPTGWLCFVVVGGLWLGIMALEQAALFRVLQQRRAEGRNGVVDSLKFAFARSRPVLLLTARISAYTLVLVAPFLAVAGIVYLSLLGQHDINFYLAKRPPEFLWAAACGALIAFAMACTLLRFLAGWLFAFPLVLFEGFSSTESLRECRSLNRSHRFRLIAWLGGWALLMVVMSSVGTWAVGLIARTAVPAVATSLPILLLAIGATVIAWIAVSVVLNLLTSTSFAALLFTLYSNLGRGDPEPEDLEPIGSLAVNVTWTRLFIGAVAGAVLSLATGAFLLESTPMEDQVEITAHRGASTLAPENTLASARAAIEVGADWVEVDVQETADGHVVVYHDADFKRIAGNELKIWNATLEDLETIDVGAWFSPDFKNERVPELEQLLETCKGKAGVAIELKYYGHEVNLERRVIKIIEKFDMESDVVIMSLNREAVEKVRKLRPTWRVGQLAAAAIGSLQRVDADLLAVSAGIASRRFIQETHAGGRQVFVWTINDAVTMSMMIGRGVDNLITDEPALARKVLEDRAKLGVAQRALLGMAEWLGVHPRIEKQ